MAKQNFLSRLDGWSNILTNLGIRGKDKRSVAQIEEQDLDQQALEGLYQSDEMAARIVDRIPEEMVREGFKISVDEDDDESSIADTLMSRIEAMGIEDKTEEALKWSRLYGGAALGIGAKDADPEAEIDLTKFKGLEYIAVLDRFQLQADSQGLVKDVSHPGFGLPEFYTIQGQEAEGIARLHASRLIRFEGVKMPRSKRARVDYWGDSVLNRLWNPIRNYATAHDSAATIIHDFTQGVFKLAGLTEMLSEGKDGERVVQERLAIVARMSSIVNGIILEEGEDYERKTTNVSGLPDMINLITRRLVAATDMPHTVLLGESPSGLGATGDSEKNDWADHIKNKQESILRPAYRRIIDILMSEKEGPTKGKIVNYTIDFNPLFQMDEKEKIEIRRIQAEIDEKYTNAGVLDPDEVATNQFNGGFSTETLIDLEAREAM